MRWFFILSVVLHTLLFVGLAMYLRPGAGATNSPFAESLPTSTTHPAMGSLPALEVNPVGSKPRERIEFEIVNAEPRPKTAKAEKSPSKARPSVIGQAKSRPEDGPKPASGFRLKQVDGYQVMIAPSFTGAPNEKTVKPDTHAASESAAPADPTAPTPPGFVPAAQTQDEQ